MSDGCSLPAIPRFSRFPRGYKMAEVFQTDKIGLASFLIVRSARLIEVKVKSRNRSMFVFDISPEQAMAEELEYTRSEHSKFFEAFRYLRDRTIRRG